MRTSARVSINVIASTVEELETQRLIERSRLGRNRVYENTPDPDYRGGLENALDGILIERMAEPSSPVSPVDRQTT